MTNWQPSAPDDAYPPAPAEARRAALLPTWQLQDGWLCRTYKTSGWKATLMAVNTIGHLAEAAWHHPDLAVSYSAVTVKLMTHSAPGITDRDFALARKIEDVLMWQPGRDQPPVLEGTPDEPRFAYLKYD